jgi:hypothetical protein
VTRLRLWILGAALGSFAAGMNFGLAIPAVVAAIDDDAAADPDQAYVQTLTADYALTAAQQRSLRVVAQRWREEELAVFRGAELSQLSPAMQGQLLTVRTRLEQRIRALLDPEQLARYDQKSRPHRAR